MNLQFNPKIMPNFDKTGPNGDGPITGRGLGKCCLKNSEIPAEKEKEFLKKRLEELQKRTK
jgi:hypothetical protein